jgi:hypothetical protein
VNDRRIIVERWLWWAAFTTSRTLGEGVLSSWIIADAAKKELWS